jgi:integrase
MAKQRGNGEGSIYERKDKDGRRIGYRGAYVVQTADGLKRRYVSGKTRREAEEKLTKAKAERDGGLVLETGKLNLGEYLERWLTDSVKDSVRASTYESYAWLIRTYVLPALGSIKLKALTPAHVQAFYRAKLDAGLSPRTVQYTHAVLHRALKQALRWNLVPRNVTEAVDPPRLVKKEVQHLTLKQATEFLKIVSEDRFEALYVLAITTGLRRGELLGLKWVDVNLNREVLSVQRALSPKGKTFNRPKNAKGRSIHLTPVAAEALKRHRVTQNEERSRVGGRWQEQGLIFPSQVGTPMNPSNFINRSFKPLLKRAELPSIRFHDLRHTFASLMLSNGEHPKIVQEILGHAQISLTLDTYSHAIPSMQSGAVGRLGELLS